MRLGAPEQIARRCCRQAADTAAGEAADLGETKQRMVPSSARPAFFIYWGWQPSSKACQRSHSSWRRFFFVLPLGTRLCDLGPLLLSANQPQCLQPDRPWCCWSASWPKNGTSCFEFANQLRIVGGLLREAIAQASIIRLVP